MNLINVRPIGESETRLAATHQFRICSLSIWLAGCETGATYCLQGGRELRNQKCVALPGGVERALPAWAAQLLTKPAVSRTAGGFRQAAARRVRFVKPRAGAVGIR